MVDTDIVQQMAPQEAFIIKGAAGRGIDREEWIVAIYLDKDMAMKHAQSLYDEEVRLAELAKKDETDGDRSFWGTTWRARRQKEPTIWGNKYNQGITPWDEPEYSITKQSIRTSIPE